MNRPSTALRLCFASALAICVLALPGGAEAGCSRLVPGDQDIVLPLFPMPNVDRPDAAFGPFSNGFVEQGTAGQTAFVVDLTISRLAYGRNISHRGLTFRAYSVGPRSPLVQLLRGGLPVQFGRVWSHGCSSKVSQSIPFSACYLRTADSLVPGEMKGEAVLTAVYR